MRDEYFAVGKMQPAQQRPEGINNTRAPRNLPRADAGRAAGATVCAGHALLGLGHAHELPDEPKVRTTPGEAERRLARLGRGSSSDSGM